MGRRGICYGVGRNDMVGAASRTSPLYPYYQLWHSMLMRCYDDKYTSLHPTYENVEVCDSWRTLSRFIEEVRRVPGFHEWERNTFHGEGEKMYLDKDIKSGETKIYSLETCLFITRKESSSESARRSKAYNIARRYSNLAKARRVEARLPDGTVREFSSSSEAGRQLNISRSRISDVLCGLSRHAAGIKFRFLD